MTDKTVICHAQYIFGIFLLNKHIYLYLCRLYGGRDIQTNEEDNGTDDKQFRKKMATG